MTRNHPKNTSITPKCPAFRIPFVAGFAAFAFRAFGILKAEQKTELLTGVQYNGFPPKIRGNDKG